MAGSKQFTIFTKFAVKNGFTGPVLGMAKGVDKFAARAESAKKTLGSFGKGLATAGKFVAGVGIGAAAAGSAVFKLAQNTASAADDILNTAGALGISTKALQEYRYVGIQAGLTTEEMDGALTKLTKNLGKGSADVDNALYQIGLTSEQLKAAGPDKSLELVADGFSRVKDPSVKAAVAMSLFGKSSVRMVNALEKGSKGIADLRGEAQTIGYVMDGEALDAAGNLDDSLDKLGATVTGVSNRLASKAIPGVTKFVQALQAGLQPGGQLSKILDSVGEFGGKIGEKMGPIIDRIMQFLPKAIAFFGNLWDAIEPALAPILGVLDPLFKIIENLMPLIVSVAKTIGAILAPIAELIKMILDGVAIATTNRADRAPLVTTSGGGSFPRMDAPMDRGGFTPMSPASSIISSSSTATSNVNIQVGNLPPGSSVKQDKPAPGVTLNTGKTVGFSAAPTMRSTLGGG